MENAQEIARRRTFAIISHPDAGKTTLTEKLLLYGGAVQLAGSVTARKKQRATTSDWMEIEKQRGISISSTVLQFDYQHYKLNLLDTPGHKDFSEDTYRVLTAVDAAIMVIDAGKGIEAQTRKLFEVCRQRGIPLFTFMNKLDRPARPPLELMDELESILGIQAFAMNWPLGNGVTFRGVFDRQERQLHLFERLGHGAYRAPVQIARIDAPEVRERLDAETLASVVEEMDMLDHAGSAFDLDVVRAGKLTPVFFGSAMNNFGVQLLLDGFLKHAPPPAPRNALSGVITPSHPRFSGYVFKIQANMNPRHRDHVAFVRVVSGKFVREMSVTHANSGQSMRLSSSHSMFGQERVTVDEAWPGDVVGIVGKDELRIGDTLTDDPAIVYDEIPRFAPECLAYLHNPSTANAKKFRKGVEQLLLEGVVQHFELLRETQTAPLLGAVGPLQFDIVQYRLLHEYGAESRWQNSRWTMVRWVDPSSLPEGDAEGASIKLPEEAKLARDAAGNLVVLISDDWWLRYLQDQNRNLKLMILPPKRVVASAGA